MGAKRDSIESSAGKLNLRRHEFMKLLDGRERKIALCDTRLIGGDERQGASIFQPREQGERPIRPDQMLGQVGEAGVSYQDAVAIKQYCFYAAQLRRSASLAMLALINRIYACKQ